MTKTYEEIGVNCFHIDLRIMKIRGAKAHCEEAPAYIRYRDDGSVRLLFWFRDGLGHREGGPAHVVYDKGKVFPGDTRTFEEIEIAGEVVIWGWWLNGRGQD